MQKIYKPKILGIVNITEDSFSDGGLYLDTDKALEHAFQLVRDGADCIDLGAASSNPATKAVSTEVETNRLASVIEQLLLKGVSVSVDTFNPAVQQYVMEQKVDYLNDIQGFPIPTLYPAIAESDCKLIVMHSVQRMGPATIIETNPELVYRSIHEFFTQRIQELQDAGISSDRIILDPGMGFFLGSNPESSIYVLKNIARLKETFGLPVLIAVSRKSFLGNISGCEVNNRGAATLAAEIYSCYQGADYIRTHDVRALHDALEVLEKLS